jgi:hypothetical protein
MIDSPPDERLLEQRQVAAYSDRTPDPALCRERGFVSPYDEPRIEPEPGPERDARPKAELADVTVDGRTLVGT